MANERESDKHARLEIPVELYDGMAVYVALGVEKTEKIRPDMVSDVLDALVKLIRKNGREAPPSHEAPTADIDAGELYDTAYRLEWDRHCRMGPTGQPNDCTRNDAHHAGLEAVAKAAAAHSAPSSIAATGETSRTDDFLTQFPDGGGTIARILEGELAAKNGELPRYIGGFCQDREKCVKRNEELAALRSAIESPRWIPLSERLPAPAQFVLCAYQNWLTEGQNGFGHPEERRGCVVRQLVTESGQRWADEGVTHWMPLPSAPSDGTAKP